MQICPFCFWEDAPGEFWHNDSNGIPLKEAQLNFRATGVCEPGFLDSVRPPLPDETRETGWQSLGDMSASLVRTIETSFAKVHRDGGITLHQMTVVDDYRREEENEEDFIRAGRKDLEYTWQEISAEKLDRFGFSLACLDQKGFRFYLPAYMCHCLRQWETGENREYWGLLRILEDGPKAWHLENPALLNDSQRAAVAAFLTFLAAHGSSLGDADDARQALRNGWNKYSTQPLTLTS